ncbi:ABC transporter permease [Niveispirillum sp. BGYR6]|uniref:ABC transporter permease n=1 Tax=Niveispirillum sp. BGYR6 TaxID=2971249 RepID=UPI0022B97EF3|nr:ABC transporter permease [Niveispirillum sp. BGYR6]MDG5496402.1 ABC transporter permease [Niveispirillum sp. BGYR6]
MSAGTGPDNLPWWATGVLLPVINVVLALIVSAIVILAIGEDPLGAMWTMVQGALGTSEGLGYTLYYATSLIFTALAVAVAFHGGLFNIGGEGQAYLGGLGVGLVCLAVGNMPWYLVLPLSVLGGAAFGGLWGAIPGYLQAYRGSHVVITTIMFNFIASSLMVYLMVNVLIRPGQMSPESAQFDKATFLPLVQDMAAAIGIQMNPSPLNFSLFLALAACVLVWAFIWHTRWGFALRTVGANENAARYAGIDPKKAIIIAMALSGALAGLLGVNEIHGVQHRLLLNFPAGMGFTGIAVALMGRNHPAGIVPAAILFGMLYQGGTELIFDYPSISRELVVVIQGVVILFAGALEHMFRPTLVRLFTPKPAGV